MYTNDATCCVYIYINTANCCRGEWRRERGRKKQEKKVDLYEYEHRLAVMTAQNNLGSLSIIHPDVLMDTK